MNKSAIKFLGLSTLTIALAFALALAAMSSHAAHAGGRDTVYLLAARCAGSFEGQNQELKLLVDPNAFCVSGKGPFKGLIVQTGAQDQEFSAMGAQVEFAGDEMRFGSEPETETDLDSGSILITMPSATPAVGVKGKIVVDTREGGSAPVHSEAELTCDLLEYMMDCAQ